MIVHIVVFMWWLFTMLLASFQIASLVSFGFVPELWGFVRLRPFVFFMDPFLFLAGFQARWPYPRNHFYLCFTSCSFYCYVALPTTCYILPPILLSQTSNPPCPSKPLIGYVTTLLSPSYSIVSCRWRWRLLHVGLCLCWDIIISLI